MAKPERSEVRSSFIAFCVFAALIILTLIIVIWNRKSCLGRVRLSSIIPLAIGGAMATYHFNNIRGFPFKHRYHIEAATLRTAYGLSSITMDFAAAWALVVMVWLSSLEKTSKLTPAHTSLVQRKHSSGYFYIMLVDLAVFGCLSAAVVIAGTFIPFEIKQCSTYKDSLMFALFAKATGEYRTFDACEKAFWIQSMTAISATITLLQIILELQFVNLPNGLRFAILFAIRLVRRPHTKHENDIELGDVDSSLKRSEQEDLAIEVTRLVEKHPHYAELIASVKESKFVASREHLELLARRSCAGKTKSQCWACEAVICEDCSVSRFDVPVPRTRHHITQCLAMCTTCYLITASSQPAAFSATLNPTDLSRQHRGCKFEEKERTMAGEVSLCRTCGKLVPGEISAIREAREAMRLAVTLKRDILCAECEKPIPKHKRRWWICGQGDHDCHWGGHDV
ncbi:hypothetical protein V8F20_012573 [Naviculisporaceae sp. PSN 640]